jgi:deazaflavin-dependent oxidoreductase (nitroreductase family)
MPAGYKRRNMAISDRIRYLNKRFTNKLFLPTAGKRLSPYAMLLHIGRKTGAIYKIPVVTSHQGEKFIFALPYGLDVDWYRNVRAAGGCELRWKGIEYVLSNPSGLDTEAGRKAFGRIIETLFRWRNVSDFAQMDGVEKNQ